MGNVLDYGKEVLGVNYIFLFGVFKIFIIIFKLCLLVKIGLYFNIMFCCSIWIYWLVVEILIKVIYVFVGSIL